MATKFFTVVAFLLSAAVVSVAYGQAIQSDQCGLEIVETTPKGMVPHEAGNPIIEEPFEARILDTAEVYLKLIESAKRSIKIASFYWALTENDAIAAVNKNFTDPDNSQDVGRKVLDGLKMAAEERHVDIQIATDSSQALGKSVSFNSDLTELEDFAIVHYINMTQMFNQGILHTKFILVDDDKFYLGSANMDWRSLTQVKELGFYIHECPLLASDLERIFQGYKYLATSVNNLAGPPTKNFIEKDQRDAFRESVSKVAYSENNSSQPLNVQLNNHLARVHLAAAPKNLAGTGRSVDLDSIISSVSKAERFVYLTAMEYSELSRFSYPKYTEWPVLFDVLREARKRGVDVRILSDRHKMSGKLANKLKESGIDYRSIVIPKYNEYQKNLPYSRLYHSKYIVTDQTVIVTTQNFAPDYFKATLGVSIVIDGNFELIDQIKHLFERDFQSSYSSIYNYVPRDSRKINPQPLESEKDTNKPKGLTNDIEVPEIVE